MTGESSAFGAYAPALWQRGIIALTRRLPENWWGRRLALWLRKPVLMALDKRPVDLCLLGFRMRLVPHDNVCEKRVLTTPQFFDSAELSLLQTRIHPAFRMVDIGANAGLYSLFVAARTGPDARILAIEAQPEMQRRLALNIALNGFTTIRQANCAVADREGTITFHLSDDNRGQASLTPETPGSCTLTVPCRSLLALMDEAGIVRPDALKIDIEGAEDIVLGHFLRMAPPDRWPRLLFMERNTTRWREDLLALCLAAGYQELTPGRMNMILAYGG